MSLSDEQVKQVARLARIKLRPRDVAQMTIHLGVVLEYMSQLNGLDTDNVEPTMHVIPLTMPLREDQVWPSLPVEEALKNAPNPQNNMFGVPRIMDGGDA